MGVSLSYGDGLARISLNRLPSRNALRAQDWTLLRDAALEVAQSPARAVILRGEGRNFCSGFDISALNSDTVDARSVIADSVNPALRALCAIPVPCVAAVDGVCVGGGLGIAATADVVVASERARFGAPYAKIGIMADAGLHMFLRQAIGYQRAAHLIFTGKLLAAAEALSFGLCSEILPADGFNEAAERFALALARGPTQAFIRSKQVLCGAQDADAALDEEARLQAEVFTTSDAREGIRAFLAGDRPQFIGS